MKTIRLAALLIAAALPAMAQDMTREPAQVRPGRYALDRSHGKITWSVSHLGFSTYTGQITDVDATLVLDPAEPARSTLEARVGTASALTHDPQLDAHLKAPDFFNVARFPHATYRSTRVEMTGPRQARVTGDLTLLGVTRPVTLEVTFNQAGLNPVDRAYTVGFDGRAVVRRSEFGMNAYLPGIGDEVGLHLEGDFKPAP